MVKRHSEESETSKWNDTEACKPSNRYTRSRCSFRKNLDEGQRFHRFLLPRITPKGLAFINSSIVDNWKRRVAVKHVKNAVFQAISIVCRLSNVPLATFYGAFHRISHSTDLPLKKKKKKKKKKKQLQNLRGCWKYDHVHCRVSTILSLIEHALRCYETVEQGWIGIMESTGHRILSRTTR